MQIRSFAVLAAVIAIGCFRSSRADDDDADGDADVDVDADADADADADGDVDLCIDRPVPDSVDLLVLVDNSGSMAQEQANLVENFGILVDGLTSPPDSDGDGIPDWDAIESLHVGVISTDMGTGGYAFTTCEDAVDGDDGILQHEPSGLVADCREVYPAFLQWSSGDDPGQIARDFACVATLGTGGCGFEQRLKAVRKAVTVHAQGANAGFLRDDSLLAILIVTDEEDCSVREDTADATDIFNTQLQMGPLNLRCYSYRDQYVEPVESYVRDLLALRPCPEDLAVFGIVGIPPDSPCNLSRMTDEDFGCVLDLPRMQEVIDNSAEGQGERLTPSCDVPGLGEAFPPRRIVELLRHLGNAGAAAGVGSICEADFGPVIDEIVNAVQPRIGP